MNKLKIIRWVLLSVTVIAIAVVIVVAMEGPKKQIVTKVDLPQVVAQSGPSVAIKNVNYSTTNNDNVKEWDLDAESAQYLQDKKTVMLENLSVRIYRPNDKIFRIRGRSGEFNTETRDIKLRGNVWGSMPDNTTIETESVDYDHQKRLVTTQDQILIRRSNRFALEGKGMIIDLANEKMTILSKVKALGSK